MMIEKKTTSKVCPRCKSLNTHYSNEHYYCNGCGNISAKGQVWVNQEKFEREVGTMTKKFFKEELEMVDMVYLFGFFAGLISSVILKSYNDTYLMILSVLFAMIPFFCVRWLVRKLVKKNDERSER